MTIKFIWGSSRVVAERWHGGLFCIRERTSSRRSSSSDSVTRSLIISTRGLLFWGGILAIVSYLAAVAVLHQWMKSRPFNLVTLEDCALYPVRRDIIQAKKGQAFVHEGLEDIKAGLVRPGMQKLTLGIMRYPQEKEGRLVLARIHVLLGSRPMAIRLLRAGLPFSATDQPYIESVLQLAKEGEDFDFWLEACEASLGQSENRSDLAGFRRWIIQKKIIGLTESGHSLEAARLAQTAGADTDEKFAELKVLALLKSGETNTAATFIEAWRKKNGPNPLLFPLQARALREADRREDMERVLAEWCRNDFTDPAPYINLVVNRASLQDKAGAQAALDAFFLRFSSYPETLIKLSEALVPLGETDLSKQCLAQAETQGFATYTLQQLLMEACITRGNLTEAQDVLDRLAPLHMANDPLAGYWVLMTRMVAAALDPSSGVQSNLVSEVQKQRLSMAAYHRLISVLRTSGQNATALDVTRLALDNYPNSTALQKTSAALLNAVTASEAAKPKLVITAVKLDSTASDKIQAATRAMLAGVDNETVFLKNLDDQIKDGKTDDALASIRTARSAQPDWLNARDDELSLTEIRLYAGQKDILTMQRLARLYLNGALLRSHKILGLATELHQAGDAELSILLVREILRASPTFARAKKALDTWVPPSAPAKPTE